MKKTAFIWVIFTLFTISALLELLAIIGLGLLGLSSYYGSHNVLNDIALILLIVDIILSIAFAYKIFHLKKDIVIWTDIVFGYSILKSLFAIGADIISSKGTASFNFVETIILLIVWVLFRRHLNRLISATISL